MSSQRALVRATLEALPPAQRFNAILFARTTTQVFPFPRTATREALDALDAAVDPNQLENGTDLVAALGRAADWVKHGGALAGGESRLLVIVSDGALPESQTAEKLAGALASVAPDHRLRVLVLLVRPAADEPVPADAVERLDKLVGRFGGVVRVLAAEDLRGVARSALAALKQGGDLFNVRMQGQRDLAAGVAPGSGLVKTWRLPLGQGSRVLVTGEHAGATVRGRASAARVAIEWLLPLVDSRAPKAWAGSLPEVAVHVERSRPVLGRRPTAWHGDRWTRWSYATLWRWPTCRGRAPATSCGGWPMASTWPCAVAFVWRSISNGASSKTPSSDSPAWTDPRLRNAVRDAAFEVEYPRPMFRDAPTVAAVNLVFRPRTPEENPPDASPLDQQLDLIWDQSHSTRGISSKAKLPRAVRQRNAQATKST